MTGVRYETKTPENNDETTRRVNIFFHFCCRWSAILSDWLFVPVVCHPEENKIAG